MAAVGALLISSGIALMAAPTTASAAQFKNVDHKIVLCHGTDSPGNPYVGISVDKHATKAHEGHSHIWNGDTWWHGVFHKDGSVKLDIIPAPGATEEAQMAYCNAAPEEPPVVTATASVTAVQPTCANQNTASYTKEGTHVASWSESAKPAPGISITVTATAEEGATFASGESTMDFPLTFEAAKTNCTAVSPPSSTTQVSPPKTKTKAHTTTESPTVVEAGLPGATGGTGADAGLALTLAGLALLASAGGLVLVEGGERK